jgi:hypothetical protein
MKRIVLTSCAFFVLLAAANAGEVYTYTDENGSIVVSNTPIPDKHKKKAVKIDSYKDTASERIVKFKNAYGLDPSKLKDIYEFADALPPEKYKQFVDKNEDYAKKHGIEYTIDRTGKITKVISRHKMDQYREDEKKREEREVKMLQQQYQQYQTEYLMRQQQDEIDRVKSRLRMY